MTRMHVTAKTPAKKPGATAKKPGKLKAAKAPDGKLYKEQLTDSLMAPQEEKGDGDVFKAILSAGTADLSAAADRLGELGTEAELPDMSTEQRLSLSGTAYPEQRMTTEACALAMDRTPEVVKRSKLTPDGLRRLPQLYVQVASIRDGADEAVQGAMDRRLVLGAEQQRIHALCFGWFDKKLKDPDLPEAQRKRLEGKIAGAQAIIDSWKDHTLSETTKTQTEAQSFADEYAQLQGDALLSGTMYDIARDRPVDDATLAQAAAHFAQKREAEAQKVDAQTAESFVPPDGSAGPPIDGRGRSRTLH